MARPEWLFDDSPIDDPMGYGQRAVDFLRALKHPKSRLPGRQWQLDPWVERLVRRIYGPVDEDGQRQVRTVFAMIPRGARKTTIGAALVCLHTFGPERVPNGQVVSAAADAKQANIAYDEALGIVQAMPEVAANSRFESARTRSGIRARARPTNRSPAMARPSTDARLTSCCRTRFTRGRSAISGRP